MKRTFSAWLLTVAVCLGTLFPARLWADDIDVVLIGGQSNATGQGYMRNLPVSFKPDRNVLFYHSMPLNRGAKPRTGEQWLPLHQASETADKFGPELSLGTRLAQRFPNRKWALIKHARSGSNLYRQWNPAEGKARGPEFRLFMKTVNEGLDKLRKQGHTPHIRAMVWQQGCADARDNAPVAAAENYAKNLTALIETVRKETNSPEMVFVLGQVMPMAAPRFPRRDIVRAQQKSLASKEKKIVWVPGDDLEMRRHDYRTPMPQDDVHLGTFGMLMLGERFANALPEMK